MDTTTRKIIQVKLHIDIENNTEFVRNKRRTIKDIETWVLPEYDSNFKNLGDNEYLLNIEYTSKQNLDNQMNELLIEIRQTADDRHCFSDDTYIEALNEDEKYWS